MIIVQVKKKKGNQDFKVSITLSEAKSMSFVLPMSLSSFHIRHHRIVTYGKHIYPFVPHSHAILHFYAVGLFCPFWVLLHAFLFEFFIQDPLSIVSFCVRDVFNFHLTDGEELWQSCTNMVQYFVLIHITFLGDFDSYLPFGFQFLAWDHLNIIYCLPCFLSMGILRSPPKTFLMWDG